MKRILITCLAVAGLPAAAGSDPIVRLDNPASVAHVLRKEGFRAKLSTDDEERPVIDSGMGGIYFSVKFYGCEPDGTDCVGVLFTAAFDTENGFDLDKINEWNAGALIGRAYLDRDCDPVIDHYLIADRTRSVALFVEEVEYWGETMADFRSFVFDEDGPAVTTSCGGDAVL